MTTPLLRQTDPLDEFVLPPELEATRPPEMRGLPRDEIRLMVVDGESTRHRRFDELVDELAPGDLLVVNNSQTIPAAVNTDDSRVVHFSTELPGGLRVVELRRLTDTGSEPSHTTTPGTIDLPDGAGLKLLAPFPVHSKTRRLWVAHVEGARDGVESLLERHGRPITYTHLSDEIPITDFQTVFANEPGSAEMPSAGRPFTNDLVTSLIAHGVAVAPLTLHTGVSSLETGEPPYPERYEVPEATAESVNQTRRRGGRVIAVGTTVVRALETITDAGGRAHPGSGWTDLVIGAGTPVRVIDGMVTGWHEPRSTHLDMLVAVAGRPRIAASYEMALRLGYLWHEFGDSHLIFAR